MSSPTPQLLKAFKNPYPNPDKDQPHVDRPPYPTELIDFTGTTCHYQHPLVRSVVYTDGVKYFADRAGAHWLLDILATELPALEQDFLYINFTSFLRRGDIRVEDGDGNVLWTRLIDYTDCPTGAWEFYMTDHVILLPSEY